MSLALFAYTRRADRDPQFILDLGLVYMVFTAVALAVVFHWAPQLAVSPVRPEISWAGAVIIMSAAIVPSTPRKTLIASFIAVSMNPLVMLLAGARGIGDFGPATNALMMHYPERDRVARLVRLHTQSRQRSAIHS